MRAFARMSPSARSHLPKASVARSWYTGQVYPFGYKTSTLWTTQLREAQRNGANRRPAAAGAAPACGTSVLSDGLGLEDIGHELIVDGHAVNDICAPPVAFDAEPHLLVQ